MSHGHYMNDAPDTDFKKLDKPEAEVTPRPPAPCEEDALEEVSRQNLARATAEPPAREPHSIFGGLIAVRSPDIGSFAELVIAGQQLQSVVGTYADACLIRATVLSGLQELVDAELASIRAQLAQAEGLLKLVVGEGDARKCIVRLKERAETAEAALAQAEKTIRELQEKISK